MSLDFDSARLPNPHFTEEHHAWREALRRFIDTEVMPYADDWDEAGAIPTELWSKRLKSVFLVWAIPSSSAARLRTAGTPGL